MIEARWFRSAREGNVHLVRDLGCELMEGERGDEANHATRDLHAHRDQIGVSQRR